MADIAERVKKIVVEHLGVEEDKVSENASFIDDLGADSLDTVELVMAFEEEFGVEIPDDAAEKILTVGDAVEFIKANSDSYALGTGLGVSPDRALLGPACKSQGIDRYATRRGNWTWHGVTARWLCCLQLGPPDCR